jgi:ribulose-phosphate 3-epimerase
MSKVQSQKSKRKQVLIAPSILSADFAKLAVDVSKVEKAGADWLHIDIMDGRFVPNITIGPTVVKCIKKHSNLLFDVHLMVERPDKYWRQFKDAGADLITFHSESRINHSRFIKMLKGNGLKAGISIKPKTKVSSIIKYLPLVDLVLVMTVEPGFGGQTFMYDMAQKIGSLRKEIDKKKLKCLIEVDGGITSETGLLCAKAGADVIVAGNAIFGKKDPKQALLSIRRTLNTLKIV